MTIEQRTGRTADEGLALFVARFQPEYPQQAINHILLGLGYFDDVDPDDALPVPRSDIPGGCEENPAAYKEVLLRLVNAHAMDVVYCRHGRSDLCSPGT